MQEPSPSQIWSNKRQRLRAQIRRTSLLNRFSQHRRQLIGHLDFTHLKELLTRIDAPELPDREKINDLIALLEDNCQKAEFNLQAGGQRLQEGFANILLTHAQSFTLEQKERLLSALTFLTYYHPSSCESLSGKEQFVDLLRKEMNALSLQSKEEVEFLQRIVVLLMNLSSLCKKEFSLYLAESDIGQSLLRQVTRTQNIAKHQPLEYQTAVSELRALVLRLLKNIFIGLQKESLSLVMSLAEKVLQDDSYFIEQPALSLALLTQAMNVDNFWKEVNKKEGQLLARQVICALDSIQMRCCDKIYITDKTQTLNEFQLASFPSLLGFFNSLFDQDSSDVDCQLTWQIAVENMLNGYILAEFLLQAHSRRKKEDVLLALKTYSFLSQSDFVTAQELIIVRPAEEEYSLLKVWLDESLMCCHKASACCLTILRNLIGKDNKFHKVLMELKVLQPLCQVLQMKENIPGLVAAIALAESLMSRSQGEEERMLQLLENKGVTKLIEEHLNHPNRQVYTSAEMFNQKYATLSSKKNPK